MISVIVPTYNNENILENCIESLGFQTYPEFEIIVIDDGSSDKTSEVLRNLQLPIPTLKAVSHFQFLEQKHKGAGAARNLGAKHAKGKILVFADDDMTFDKNFLAKLVEPIEKGEVKGTWSREESVANWGNFWARCWNINEGWEPGRRHPKNYPEHQPVFRAILKSEFDRVEGFTAGGYDDDWSLSKKLGYEAVNSPGAIFYHKNPSSISEVFGHAKWVGKRGYKLGFVGNLVALVRSSLPISLITGFYKGIIHGDPRFIIFKVIYDLGIFVGILELLIFKKFSK